MDIIKKLLNKLKKENQDFTINLNESWWVEARNEYDLTGVIPVFTGSSTPTPIVFKTWGNAGDRTTGPFFSLNNSSSSNATVNINKANSYYNTTLPSITGYVSYNSGTNVTLQNNVGVGLFNKIINEKKDK